MPQVSDRLLALSYELAIESAKLSAVVHPVTAGEIAKLVANMNCYYSNLIEGHNTKPADIDRALRGDYSEKPEKRVLQLEARAHIEVEQKYLAAIPLEFPLTADRMMELHKDFYERLPEDLHVSYSASGKMARVIPGALRETEVEVGRHNPPAAMWLSAFMKRMEEAYRSEWEARKLPYQKIPVIAAAHHRLLWIHPFLDGNGRVTRLMAVLALKAAGIDGVGLWSPARGLARKVDDYKGLLQEADSQRQGDYDGRGNLSAIALGKFCEFFIETCLDQVKFMASMLDMDTLEKRVHQLFHVLAAEGRIPYEAALIVSDAIRHGGIMRERAERLTGKSDRWTRDLMGKLEQAGLIINTGQRSPYLPAFPAYVTGFYFPNLFPAGSPDDIPIEVSRPRRAP